MSEKSKIFKNLENSKNFQSNLNNQELKIKNLSFSKFDSNLKIILNPEFKKKIFEEALDEYSPDKLAFVLNSSSAMLYHYKNNRTKSVSVPIIEKIKSILSLKDEEIEKNTIDILTNKEIKNKGLELGRNFRREQLKNFRTQIPRVNDIIEDNFLNLEKWFSHYQKLINFGCREIKNIEKEDNILKVTYTNYANGKKKIFTTLFPRKIKIDEDFQYFFGLWVGDKAGGGRLGIMNKEKTINLYAAECLKKLYQNPEFVLHVHDENIPRLDYKIDKVVRINSVRNGYAISVHAINSIFKSFFDYLEEDLDNFLNLIPNKNIFFAGLFDAEGNIFLEDKCFRWSSKNERNIEIFKKHLKEMNLFHRFDGANLVTYNRELFAKDILPFIKHPARINDANLICFKRGILNKRFKEILEFIKNNPGESAKAIAKALKRAKISSQLLFLLDNNYIYRNEYPNKMYITNKGVASLSHGGKDI